MATTKEPIAIIAGVGSGTGAALARRFAKSYPVVLLARNPSNFESLAAEINKSGGTAVGISTDLSSEESVANAFAKIKESDVCGGAPVAAAVFNASTRPKRKPFLESTAEEFGRGYDVSVYVYDVHLPFAIIGLFLFFSLFLLWFLSTYVFSFSLRSQVLVSLNSWILELSFFFLLRTF